MSTTEVTSENTAQDSSLGIVDMKLEVVTLPVSDVDRAKRFYQSLGWRCDADFAFGDELPRGPADAAALGVSIAFGKGLTTGEPGSVKRLLLVVYDIEAARDDLVSRGVEVSEVFHLDGGACPGPGPRTPVLLRLCLVQRSGWQRVAASGDQDAASGSGVGGLTMDIASLADLLHETAEHHGPFEAVPRRTTGGTGTRHTWTRASAGTPRTRPPRPPGATWPM